MEMKTFNSGVSAVTNALAGCIGKREIEGFQKVFSIQSIKDSLKGTVDFQTVQREQSGDSYKYGYRTARSEVIPNQEVSHWFLCCKFVQ
jgi:hypothetical protein